MLNKPKVLAVDDAAIQLAYLSHLLDINGFEVRSAANASQALQFLAEEDGFDAIITDVVMPEISGYDLCKAVRADQRTKQIPVILLTSLTELQDILEGLESGADNYVCKPFDDDNLIECIRTTMEASRTKPAGMQSEVQRRTESAQMIATNPDRALHFLCSTFEHYAIAKRREHESQLAEAQHRIEAERARIEAERVSELSRLERIHEKKEQERLGQFYSMAAHELRSPLTAISASLALLLNGAIVETLSQEDQSELVQMAQSQCQRLLRLVDDYLDLKKLEAGRIEMRETVFRPREIVDTTLRGMKAMADRSSINLRAQILSDGLVKSDEDRIIQVLTNLLSNAIKFSAPHSDVLVRVSQHNKAILFNVIDHGPGIREKDVAKLFGCFQQLTAPSPEYAGTGSGLGLAISKEIVSALGGNIGVSSTMGEGSNFWFELPALDDQTQRPHMALQDCSAEARSSNGVKLNLIA